MKPWIVRDVLAIALASSAACASGSALELVSCGGASSTPASAADACAPCADGAHLEADQCVAFGQPAARGCP